MIRIFVFVLIKDSTKVETCREIVDKIFFYRFICLTYFAINEIYYSVIRPSRVLFNFICVCLLFTTARYISKIVLVLYVKMFVVTRCFTVMYAAFFIIIKQEFETFPFSVL